MRSLLRRLRTRLPPGGEPTDDVSSRLAQVLRNSARYLGTSWYTSTYNNSLASDGYLNLDIPFVPHITLGVFRDKTEAKRLCDELIARGIAISGEVNALSIAALEAGKIRDLETFPLIG